MNGDAQTLLGFDYGTRRIGVAVGQTVTRTASPLTTLARRGRALPWGAIGQLIAQWQPQALVVGVARRADGSLGTSGRGAERFARALAGRFGLTVHRVDERLSSAAAAECRPARGIDAGAAAVILQRHLDGGRDAA